VTGLIGAIVLASFFRAVGNVLLYEMFINTADAQKIILNIGKYIAAGATLLAPYAVNQLASIFKT
jgi:hypothetical protein